MSLDCTSRGVSGLLYTTSCPWTAHLEVCLVYYIQHHVPRLHIQRCVWFIIYSMMTLDYTSRGVSGLLYTTSCPQTAHLQVCLVYYILHHVPRLNIQRCVWFIIYSIMSLDCTSRGVSCLLYTTSCPLTTHLEVCLVYYILHHVPRLHIQRCVWFITYYSMSLDCRSRGVSGLLYTTSCPWTAHLEVCLVYYIPHHVPRLHIQRCVWFIIYSIMSLDAHLEVFLVYYIQHHVPGLHIQRCVWFIIYSIMSLDCSSRGVSDLLCIASCPQTAHLEVCLVYYIQHHVPRLHIQRCVWFIIYSIMSLDCTSRGVSCLLYTTSCPLTTHLEVCLVYYILHHVPRLHIQRCVLFITYYSMSLDCRSRGVSGLLYTTSCPWTAHLEVCLVYYILHHLPRLHIQRCVLFIIYYIMSLDCTSRGVSDLLYSTSCPQTAHLEVCLVYYIPHHVPRLHIQRCVWFIIYSIMSQDCTSRGVSGLLYTASCPWTTHLEVCLVYYIQHHVPRLHIQRCV